MKSDRVTQERLKELLKYDPITGIFTRNFSRGGFRKGTVAGSTNQYYGYIHISLDKRMYKAHRLAFLYMEGRWPDGEVDHLNGDRAYNAWDNLKESSSKENSRNCARRSDNTSGVAGVGFHKRRKQWRARMGTKHLGWYPSKELAIAARIAAQEGLYSDRHGKEYSEFNSNFYAEM